jgi:hypothetical protein
MQTLPIGAPTMRALPKREPAIETAMASQTMLMPAQTMLAYRSTTVVHCPAKTTPLTARLRAMGAVPLTA